MIGLLLSTTAACRNNDSNNHDDDVPIVDDNGESDDTNDNNQDNTSDDNDQDDTSDDIDDDTSDLKDILYTNFNENTITDFSNLSDYRHQRVVIGGYVVAVTDEAFILYDGDNGIEIKMSHMTNDYNVGDILQVTGSVGTFRNLVHLNPLHIQIINSEESDNREPIILDSLGTFLDDYYNKVSSLGKVFAIPVFYDGKNHSFYALVNDTINVLSVYNLGDYLSDLETYENQVISLKLTYVSELGFNQPIFTIDEKYFDVSLIDNERLQTDGEVTLLKQVDIDEVYFIGDKITLPETSFLGGTYTWDFSHESLTDEGVVKDNFTRNQQFWLTGELTYKEETYPLLKQVHLIAAQTEYDLNELKDVSPNQPVIVEGIIYSKNYSSGYIYDGTGFVIVSNLQGYEVGDSVRVYGLNGSSITDTYVTESETAYDLPESRGMLTFNELQSHNYQVGEIVTIKGYFVDLGTWNSKKYQFIYRDEVFRIDRYKQNDFESLRPYLNENISFNMVYVGEELFENDYDYEEMIKHYRPFEANLSITIHDKSEVEVELASDYYEDMRSITRYEISNAFPTKGYYETNLTWVSQAPDLLDNNAQPVKPLNESVTVTFDLTIEKGGYSKTVPMTVVYYPTDVEYESHTGETFTLEIVEGVIYDSVSSSFMFVYTGDNYYKVDFGLYQMRINNHVEYDDYYSDFTIGDKVQFITAKFDNEDVLIPSFVRIIEDETVSLPDTSNPLYLEDFEDLVLSEGQIIHLNFLLENNHTIVHIIENDNDSSTSIYIELSTTIAQRNALNRLLDKDINVKLYITGAEYLTSEENLYYYSATLIGNPWIGDDNLAAIDLISLQDMQWSSISNTIEIPTVAPQGSSITWEPLTDNVSSKGKLLIDVSKLHIETIEITVNDGMRAYTDTLDLYFFDTLSIKSIQELESSSKKQTTQGTIFFKMTDTLFLFDDNDILVVRNSDISDYSVGDSVVVYGHVNISLNGLPNMNAERIIITSSDEKVPQKIGEVSFNTARNLAFGDIFTIQDTLIFETYTLHNDFIEYTFIDPTSSREVVFVTDQPITIDLIENNEYTIDWEVLYQGAERDTYYFILKN